MLEITKNANQPVWCPLYEDPPYRYTNVEKVSVVIEVERDIIEHILPAPLKPIDGENRIVVYLATAEAVTPIGVYQHCGIEVPCEFEGKQGGCVVYQGVSTEAALCSGREIWGFPKKLITAEFKQDGVRFAGYAEREGSKLISATAQWDPEKTVEGPTLFPRLLVRVIPRGDKPGIDSRKVFYVKSELTIKEKLCGDVQLDLGGTIRDPWYKLAPKKVLGAIYAKLDLVLPYGEEVG